VLSVFLYVRLFGGEGGKVVQPETRLRGRGEGGATGDEANTRALAGQCCSLFLSRLLLQSSPGFLCVLPWLLSLVFLWFFSSSRRCVFSLFFPPLPLFCSAFYRARELAPLTSPCYSPTFTGLLINPRAGLWAKEVVHDRIELLPFSLLNRLSRREMEGIMNSSSKRRHLCPWEWLFFTLVPELLTFIN